MVVAEGFGKVIHIDFGGQIPEGYKIVGNTVKVVEPQSMMIIEDELEAQHALGKLKNVIQLRKSGIIKKVAKTAGYVASTGGSGYNTVNDISGSDNKPNIQEQSKEIMDEFSAKKFEESLTHLSPSERVAKIKIEARKIAGKKHWIKRGDLSAKNGGREIYYDTLEKQYYSVDTYHGRFEVCNKRGKHLGEVDFEFKPQKEGDFSQKHDIFV